MRKGYEESLAKEIGLTKIEEVKVSHLSIGSVTKICWSL
jgi:hypothetical protein